MNQQQAVDTWWRSLDAVRRADMLEIEPGEFLAETTALDLMLYDVHVADVAVAWDVDDAWQRITVYVQPRVLTDYLAGVRALR